MTRILRTAAFAAVGIVLSILAARDAAAIQLTLNLVQSESHLTITGDFSGIPFSPQDVDVIPPDGGPGAPPAGIMDFDPASPSNRTTFQGPITIDVDNVNSPTTIQFLSAIADADVSGQWLPEVQPYLDVDMDNEFGEFGDDSLAANSDPPQPGMDADWGIRNVHPAFGVDLAYGGVRDIVYNITSPVEAVVGGQFSSLTENFEFASGWLDYWVAPAGGNIRGRSELAGGDDDNASVLPSIYTVTMLPNNKREIRLVIPIDVNAPDDDANFFYDGQFVATLVVPEPSTFMLVGFAMSIAAAVAARRRN